MLFPVREMAKYGILADPDPYDIPSSAWSSGVNVRFRNGSISRAPVWRNVFSITTASPRYVFGSNPALGSDLVFIGYLSGRVYKFTAGVESNYSPTGYVDEDSEATWSNTHLADVLYVNRENRVPWFLRTSDTEFQELSGWDSTWRAKLLRACGGSLIALNVTKGATAYPTMVKTSSFPTASTVPASWDHTLLSTNATENILAEMKGAIVDAQTLGSNLCIYGANETWIMQPVGAGDIFAYQKLPFSKGSINTNCSVEVDGKNYVFGVDDVWMHDGVSSASICDEKTRDYIFNAINLNKASRCFVTYNVALKEISFHYVSGDELVAFNTSTKGCNRAAVYSLVNGTWAFDDEPFVYSGARVNLDTSITYATVTTTYANTGATYISLDDGLKRAQVFVGAESTDYGLSARLYAHDLYGKGSLVSSPVDEAATQGMFLERLGIDLDEVGAELRGEKILHSIYPQARLGEEAAPLEFEVGAADYFNQDPVWAEVQTYDGAELRKLDFGQTGRWLSIRVNFPDYKEVTLTGFDMDLDVISDE